MDAKLQRRIQRRGWDLAADHYEPLWQAQVAIAHAALLEWAELSPGEAVLDVACGTGLVTFLAAEAVGPTGRVLGIDISPGMIEAALRSAEQQGFRDVRFASMDAEDLSLPDDAFDVVLCALGLMYAPEPEAALREMWRVLRPGGRLVVTVWGERENCGWSAVFPIVDAEVAGEVCPLFFRLGGRDVLAGACRDAGFVVVRQKHIVTTLRFDSPEAACDAAFVGGPVAMAWSRFDDPTRLRALGRYLKAIEAWGRPDGYAIPGEFVVVAAKKP